MTGFGPISSTPISALPASGALTPPALDGYVSGAVGYNNSSKSVSLTTTNSNDIIVVVVGAENSSISSFSSSVSSVTASGLTFANRLAQHGRNTSGGLGPDLSSIEIWWAVAASPLSSESITVSFSHAVDCGVVIAFGVSGANTTSPWDSNDSLSAFSTTGDTVTISTDTANDLLLFISEVGGTASGGPLGATSLSPGTWTQIASQNDNSGFANEEMIVSYSAASGTVSSTAYGGTPGETYPNNAMDAIRPAGSGNIYSASVTETGDASDSVAQISTDGNVTTNITSGTTASVSLTTQNDNDIIVVISAACVEGSTPTCYLDSITSDGLSFTRRQSSNSVNDEGTFYWNLDVWYAVAASPLSSQTIDITTTEDASATYGDSGYNIIVFAVNGIDTSGPWDANGSLPAINGGPSGPPAVTVSTTNPNDFILTFETAIYPYSQTGTGPTGFTEINGVGTSFGEATAVFFQVVTQTLSSQTITWGASGNGAMYLDALTANSGGIGGGGTTYTPSITESGSASDTISASTGDIDATVTESGSAADTVAASIVWTAAVSESGSAADAIGIIIAVQIHEMGNAQDVVTGMRVYDVSVIETGSAADAQYAVLNEWDAAVVEMGEAVDFATAAIGNTIYLGVVEAGDAQDTVSGGPHRDLGVVESLTITEVFGASVNGTWNIGVGETLTITEVFGAAVYKRGIIVETGSAQDSVSAYVGTPGTWNVSVVETGAATDTIGQGQTFPSTGIYFWGYGWAYGVYPELACWIAGLDCGNQTVNADGSVFVPYRSDPDGLFTPSWLFNLSNNPPLGGFGATACNIDLTGSDGTVYRVVVDIAIGVPYTSRIQLLRPNSQDLTKLQAGPGLGFTRRLQQYAIHVANAQGVSIGTTEDNMLPIEFTYPDGSKYAAHTLFTGVNWGLIEDAYSFEAMMMITVDRPYPMTVMAMAGMMHMEDRN